MCANLYTFKHCKFNFYAKNLPVKCPECARQLNDCNLEVPPLMIPSPFSRAQDNPCCIAVKPNKKNGDFLTNYKNGDNLHVAITNSKGYVIEFDQYGIHMDRTLEWDQCIIIDFANIIDQDILDDPDWAEYWDMCIGKTLEASDPDWSANSYDENERNCFSFVLECLKKLKHPIVSEKSKDKIEFCKSFMIPKTQRASKYIKLYRNLMSNEGILKIKCD